METGARASALDAVFERAEKEVREGILPSVQIAIAREGKIAGMRTFGRATFGGIEADANDDSLYCVFSCTKAITSAAAWLLIEEVKLSVDEQVYLGDPHIVGGVGIYDQCARLKYVTLIGRIGDLHGRRIIDKQVDNHGSGGTLVAPDVGG